MKNQSHLRLNSGLLLALIFLASACTRRPESAATVAAVSLATPLAMHRATAPLPLTEEILKNMEYQGVYEEPVKLADGEFLGQPFVEGGASRPALALRTWATGDLDGDGVAEAAVLLAESSGGSGTFMYLAAVANREAGPRNLSTLLLGDRIKVQSIRLEDGLIRLAVLRHGPEDPLCCPSQPVEMLYRFEAGQLAPAETR